MADETIALVGQECLAFGWWNDESVMEDVVLVVCNRTIQNYKSPAHRGGEHRSPL